MFSGLGFLACVSFRQDPSPGNPGIGTRSNDFQLGIDANAVATKYPLS